MKTASLIVSALLLSSALARAQTIEFPGYFRLGPNASVVKLITVPGCAQSYTAPAGRVANVTHNSKLTMDGSSITVNSSIQFRLLRYNSTQIL